MPRARNLKPGFFRNEVLCSLDPMARLLFAGLWLIADRDGRMEDRPKRILIDVFPYESQTDVDGLLAILDKHGFIHRYEADGIKVIQIVSWKRHVNPYKNEPTYNLPDPPVKSELQSVATDSNRVERGCEYTSRVKKEEERGNKEEEERKEGGVGGEASVALLPRPMDEFIDSPEALADEFAKEFDGVFNAAERDVRQVTPMIRAVFGFGFSAAQIREEIYRQDRDKNQKIWQFKKHFEDIKRQPRSPPSPTFSGIKAFRDKHKGQSA